MSDRACCLVLFVAALTLASVAPAAAQPVSAQPIPITTPSQTICYSFAGPPEPPVACTSGGTSVNQVINASDGSGLTVTGLFNVQSSDGKLFYIFNGSAINSGPTARPFVITVEQPSSFTVPQNLVAGASPLPSTLVASSLTASFSTIPPAIGREMRFAPFNRRARGSSAVLGDDVSFEITDLLVQTHMAGLNDQRDVRMETLPAGDQVEITLIPQYWLLVGAGENATFQDTLTLELNFVPEPSPPLALSSGIGLLLALATRGSAK